MAKSIDRSFLKTARLCDYRIADLDETLSRGILTGKQCLEAMPNKIVKVFVISLVRAPHRRRLMSGQLDQPGFPAWDFVDAVDGKLLADDELGRCYDAISSRMRYGKDLSLGTIACALSHVEAYKRIVQERADIGLILEDDALIGEHTWQVMDRLVNKLNPAHPEIVLLSHAKYVIRQGRERLDRDRYRQMVYMARGAHGYLVTKAAAKCMAEALLPISIVADHWEHIQNKTGIRVSAVIPYSIGRSPVAGYSEIQLTTHDKPQANAYRRLQRKLAFQWSKLLAGAIKQPSSW